MSEEYNIDGALVRKEGLRVLADGAPELTFW